MEPPSLNQQVAFDHKLRLMCSYGGKILSRPQTKSLYYAGGDTRIVTVPPPSSGRFSLSAFLSQLASTLHITYPFMVKYQLPNHGLDSLISVSTDEDLLVMLEEYRLLSSSPQRIRIFLYPLRRGSRMEHDSELKHPKRESFFVDALKGVVGYNGDESGGHESIALETSSSFGSTSSSASLTNLPAMNGDMNIKSPSTKNTSGDTHLPASVFCPQQFSAPFGNPRMSTNPFQSEGLWPMAMRVEPQVQAYYPPQNHPSFSPFPYYTFPSMMSQSQHLYQQTTHPSAIYYVPVEQSYNMPAQCKNFDQGPPSVRPNASDDNLQENDEEVIATQESLDDEEEQIEEAAMVQIYKSQPPPPASLAQFQVTKAPNLNEAFEQLHFDSSLQVNTTHQ